MIKEDSEQAISKRLLSRNRSDFQRKRTKVGESSSILHPRTASNYLALPSHSCSPIVATASASGSFTSTTPKVSNSDSTSSSTSNFQQKTSTTTTATVTTAIESKSFIPTSTTTAIDTSNPASTTENSEKNEQNQNCAAAENENKIVLANNVKSSDPVRTGFGTANGISERKKGVHVNFLSLNELVSKSDVDRAIRKTFDKLVVLRFGRENDIDCMKLDNVLSKCQVKVSKMADIYVVDVDAIPVYTKYFDITLVPSTVFFFNAHLMKCDYGSPDHTKFVGSFQIRQDFIDLVEVFYRGAMQGKIIVKCPIDPERIPHYQLLYRGY